MSENTDQIEQNQEPEQIHLNDVLEEKVNYFELPKQEKERLRNEYYETLPPEDKAIFKEGGYTPKQMFGGKDRQGNPVEWKSPEEFKREFLEKGKRSYKELDQTKQELFNVKRQLEEVTNMIKFQTSSTFESQERELQAKISKAKEEYDFESYEKLKNQEFELKQRKTQFIPVKQEVESPQIPQYTAEEQEAIEEFRYSNPDFTESLRNTSIRNSFDDFVKATAKNRPDLPPKEILRISKQLTESVFPDLAPKQQKNVFMNNQYQPQSSSTLTRKPKETKILFENLGEWDKKFIIGSAKNFPGKSYQEVLEILQPKKK